MSKKGLGNAEEIIERFGGIRPMAAKIDTAVTTVQGWKVRGKIPAKRADDVRKAAKENNINLDDLIDETPAALAPSAIQEAESITASKPADNDAILTMIQEAERRAIVKSSTLTAILVALSFLALGLLLWPSSKGPSKTEYKAQMEEIARLQAELEDIKKRQGFFGSVVPEDLKTRLEIIQQKAEDAAQNVDALSRDMLGEGAEALRGRLATIESQLGQLSDVPLMANLTQRFASLAEGKDGQALIDQSMQDLMNAFGDDGKADLAKAKTESLALQATFEGVPPQDLKAAALLLTMTQVRDMLGRKDADFADDLVLLQNLTAGEDAELSAAISKLAPHANGGLLSTEGLTDALKSISGDIVVASLQGDDVSIQDQLSARLGTVFQLEKDGEPVGATPEQIELSKARNALAVGDIATAITSMETLEGDAAALVAPWLDKAKATHAAHTVKSTLDSILSARKAGAVNFTGSSAKTVGDSSAYTAGGGL